MMPDPESSPDLEFSDVVDGPFIMTFTAHLPFTLGIPNELGHTISFAAPFVDKRAATSFDSRPFVNIRVFNSERSGLRTFLDETVPVLGHFYGFVSEASAQTSVGDDAAKEHEQWVTLETPYALIEGENAADKAFAFPVV